MADTTSTLKTYIITPHDGSPPYQIRANNYEFSEQTGRHVFKQGEDIVANLLNVGVRQQQD